MIRNTPKRIEFKGGINNIAERATLNGFSAKNNYRDLLPYGFEQRTGQARHHSTTDVAQEVTRLFQLVDRAGVRHLYAQRVDGSVHEATNNPPTTTVGNFGAQVLGTSSSTYPASIGIMDNYMMLSDGTRQHQIYAGTGQRVSGFIVYKGSGAIPVIPQIGEDYTDEVSDSVTTRVAPLNSLNTLANNQFFMIITELPAKSFTFTVQNTNGIAATLSGQYWNGAWTSLTGLSDGMAVGGATIAQSGTVSFTMPTDDLDYYQFGKSGFCYRFAVSAQIGSSVSISQVTYTADWQAVRNVWSGELVPIAEAQVYRANNLKYERYAGDSINISGLFTTTGASGDWLYFATPDPIFGIYVDTGATPNITKAAITGSTDISFMDGGSSDDWITWQQARFSIEGFEEGQSIVITNSISNNITVKAKATSADKIYVETGKLTSESNKSATLTYDNTGATMDFETWTGAGYTNVLNLNDGSSAFSKNGYITMSRTTASQKSMQNGSNVYLYWHRIQLNKVTSRNCQLRLFALPYYDIADFGYGQCNSAWGGESKRYVIASDKDPVAIIGQVHRPMVFNGTSSYAITVGDGRANRVLAMANLYADLLVFQEERGWKGGCITMVQGYDPKTFGKMPISDRVGIVNSKAYCVIDGFETPNNPKAQAVPVVFFISRQGIYYCDGAGLVNISYEIGAYFDTSNTTNCIRRGYENKHWIGYDSSKKVILVGLCTGSSATVANTFLVFDLKTRAWGTDSRGQALTCFTEVEANSGNIPVLQYAGSSDGFIYRLNTGTDDVGASTVAVDSYAVYELDGGGSKIHAKTVQLRSKAQSAGNITESVAYNGNTSYTDSNTISMTARTAGDTYRYEDFTINNELHDHISFKFEHNTAGESCTLLDFILLDAEGKNVFKN